METAQMRQTKDRKVLFFSEYSLHNMYTGPTYFPFHAHLVLILMLHQRGIFYRDVSANDD